MVDIIITTNQAAEMLRCSYRTVINYCKARKLSGTKNPVTGIWRISLNSVLCLKENRVESNTNSVRIRRKKREGA